MTTDTVPQKTHWYDYIFVNINWFSLTLRTQVLAGLIVPLLVQNFVGEAQKGSYYGTIRLWALMVALLTQSLMGLLSDRSRSKWGRRRPFIFVGAILEVLVIASMIWIAGLEGMTGYTVLFIAYILSMILDNTAQAATQGLIPDLVPQEKRGIASGVKVLLEVPLPLVVVGLVITPLISNGNLREAVLVTCGVMLFCMLLTMLVREKPLTTAPEPINRKPVISLVLMTAVFTAIILGLGQIVKYLIPIMGNASKLAFGTVGVVAMIIAVVVGIFAALSVHSDKSISKNTTFIWLIISRLAAFVAINNIASFLLYFVQEKFALPTSEAVELAGQLPMVLGGFIVLFGLIAGWLCDRFDRKLMTILSGIIGAIGVAVTVFGNDITSMYVAAAIIGMAYAFYNVSSWALTTDLVPKERVGEFLGLQNLAGAGAGAIGAYIGGTIADHSGYVLLMAMFGVMFLLSSVASLFIKENKS
jgi:MFS family permease